MINDPLESKLNRRSAILGSLATALTSWLPKPKKRFRRIFDGGLYAVGIPNPKYKDLYISPEALQDIKNWSVDTINEKTRKEFFVVQT